jgi:tetratricopeptide (TPR) repeat protein
LNEDSLWKVFNASSTHDTDKLGAIHNLAWQMVFTDPDSAIVLAQMELQLSKEKTSERYEADAYSTIGVAYINKADYKNALDFHQHAFALREKINDRKAMAASLNNIGIVYNYEGDIATSIDYYEKSLKLKLEIKDMAGVAAAYSNLGQVYAKQKMEKESLDYFLSSLHIRDSLQDKRGLEDSYAKLASYYGNGIDYNKAKDYTLKAIPLTIELHNKRELANNYENLGLIYDKLRMPDSAEKYYNISLEIKLKANNIIGIASCYYDLGALRLAAGKVDEAIGLLLKVDKTGVEEGDLELEQEAKEKLADAFERKGDFKNAFINLRRSNFIKDSLNTLEKSKSIAAKILRYEFLKRATDDSLKLAKETEVKDLRAKQKFQQQQTYTIAGVIGFILMGIIAFVLLRGFRQKQKNNEALETKNKIITEQKQEVEIQKALVEEKNKAVLDSIHYAERIQKALLPTEKYIERNLDRLKKPK